MNPPMQAPRPYAARLLRVAVDAVVIALAYVAGVVVDYAIRVRREPVSGDVRETVAGYLPALLPLLAVALAVFALSGFYSRQRTYRGRPKAAAVTQATLLAFLGYGAIAYTFRAYLLFPPAIAIAAAGGICLAALLGLRLYGTIWKRLARRLASAIDPDSEPMASVTVAEHQEVVVIGGGGYIGSALVPQLLAQGMRVRLLDGFFFGREPIAPFASDPRLTIQEADYRRTDQLVIAMRHADTVIHLGGIVGDPACTLDEGLTIELNVAANRAVAEIASAQQVRRFIFASSCSVYGANDEILDENSKMNPVSLYARSKVASEVVLEQLADASFTPTILRLGTVYGLSGRIRFDLVVNLLTAKAAVEGVIPVVGPGQWRPFVHVSDAAAAFALAASTPSPMVGNRIYNVGSNEQNLTLGSLGRLIQQKVPQARLVESADLEDKRTYRVGFDRIASELGYRPAWTLDAGIDQILDAIRTGRVGDYRRADYSNVAWLRELLDLNRLQSDGRSDLASLESEMGFSEDPEAVRQATVG
ncbi:MAG: NAD-dependent epimerase/dehydratase family protein [Candidatus Nanopelagicales bacterium]